MNLVMKTRKQSWVLKITIKDIYRNKINLGVELSTYYNEKIGERDYFHFFDERTVVCTRKHKQWVYKKTFETKDL
jgi:hypothetical protein